MKNIIYKKTKSKNFRKYPKVIQVIIVIALLAAAGTYYFTNDNEQTLELNEALVLRVVDGDTIKVDYNGGEETVRFIGIDTPESVHPDKEKNVPYGKIATAFTKDKLENKKVSLEFDVEERDRYGRLLAYVYLDDKMFNKTLLEEGHAMLATYPPNVKYVDDFTVLQEKAREEGKGLWE